MQVKTDINFFESFPKSISKDSTMTQLTNIKSRSTSSSIKSLKKTTKKIINLKELSMKRQTSKSQEYSIPIISMTITKKTSRNYILKSSYCSKRNSPLTNSSQSQEYRTNPLISYYTSINLPRINNQIQDNTIKNQLLKKSNSINTHANFNKWELKHSPLSEICNTSIQMTSYEQSINQFDDLMSPIKETRLLNQFNSPITPISFSNVMTMSTPMTIPLEESSSLQYANQNYNTDNLYLFNQYNPLSHILPSSEEILSLINSLSINHVSCKLLQNKILYDHIFTNETFFPLIKSSLIEMLVNQLGNYLIQNTLEVLSISNLLEFLNIISPHFFQIAYCPHGTRAIQKLIERLDQSPELITGFNQLLLGNIPSFSNDENANHIIQKYLSLIKYPFNGFIYEAIYFYFFDIAVTKHGCCVVQKCLIFGTKQQKDAITSLIINNTNHLITNQFGNYVYQYVIQMNTPQLNHDIAQMIIPNIYHLSKHKYASNALEKCLQLNTNDLSYKLMAELIKNEEIFIDLLLDSYGNYVIQTALNISKGEFYYKGLDIIARHHEKINRVSFGYKLMKKLLSCYIELGKLVNQQKQYKLLSNNTNNSSTTDSNYYSNNNNIRSTSNNTNSYSSYACNNPLQDNDYNLRWKRGGYN